MEKQTDQFKATTLWNKYLSSLNDSFKKVKTRQLNGKNIFDISFTFFNTNGTREVTEEKINKLCQSLLDTNVIYDITQSSGYVVFKKAPSIFYRSYEIERTFDESTRKTRRTNSVLSIGSGNIKMSLFGDNQEKCLERSLILEILLKILDISMIQGMTDLCQMAECNHVGTEMIGWRCDQLDKYREIELTDDERLHVHHNCIQLLLGTNYIEFTKSSEYHNILSSAAQSAVFDCKLIGIVYYLSHYPEILMWTNLTEVFRQLHSILYLKAHQDTILKCMQLSFNLLPDQSQHLSYHLFASLNAFISKVSHTVHTRDIFLQDFGRKLLSIGDGADNYDRTAVMAFIVFNHDQLLSLPNDLVSSIIFIRDQARNVDDDIKATPKFSATVSATEYKSASKTATEAALAAMYTGLVARNGPYERLTPGEAREHLRAFRATHRDLYDRLEAGERL